MESNETRLYLKSFERKVFFIVVGILLTICIGYIVFVMAAGIALGPSCVNTSMHSDYSPDYQFKIVTFSRDCGATTGFNTQVSIVEASGDLSPSEGGNIFIADTNHGAAPVTQFGGPWVDFYWKSNLVLEIRYHGKARVFKSEKEYGKIQIHYQVFD